MKNTSKILAVMIIVFSFIGCSDKLTDGKAEKIIRSKLTFPLSEQVRVEHGLVAYQYDSLPAFYYALQQKKMLTIEPLGKGGFFITNYRFRITPTAEGKKYAVREAKEPVKQGASGEFLYTTDFKSCELAFEEVESVQEQPGLNQAIINYAMRRTNFTPFWSYYEDKEKKRPDTIQHTNFMAVKTNDGWRSAKD